MSLADLEVIETLDGIRALLRRCGDNPNDREAKRELRIQQSTFWQALEVRESVAMNLERVSQRSG